MEGQERMTDKTNPKVYVSVTADFSEDGRLIPKSFVWEDGHRYEIDRVKRIERRGSRRVGGTGLMYTCMVEGREIHLFYEENYKWFLARKL